MTGAEGPGDRLRRVVRRGREERVYSAAAWSTGAANGRHAARGWLGTRRWGGEPVDGSELWDLASVTKPIVGVAALALVERGALDLDDTVRGRLAGFREAPCAGATVRHLLTHTSGLPGQVRLHRRHPTRTRLLDAVRATPLRSAPGTRVEYSSLGFIVLGLLLEAVTGRGLDALVDELVCAPLKMTRTSFNPPAAPGSSFVATEECPWRGRVVHGEVHDENAVVLGGVCGHAGLFAPLRDVERLAVAMAGEGGGVLTPATLRLMTSPHTDGLNLRRGLAWQGLDAQDSPVGPAFGPRSFGHTGFTGTSVWIDPLRGRYAVLLTNRVHPTRDGDGIRRVRHAFHEAAAPS